MADAAASLRQQRANRLLTLCAVGKFADAAFDCCAATVNPLLLQQVTGAAFAAGGTISWVEPLQITPQMPPKITTGLCMRVCAVFQRYAFGRGQVIFDLGFGPDERVFDIVADPTGYHLVEVPKQPGSYWAIDQLPDPAVWCKVRVECHLAPHTKQVLAFPVPPTIENCQIDVSVKTFPEGVSVLAAGSTAEKAQFLVADYVRNPVATAELAFQYKRRVLTVKTPQPGQKLFAVHLHDTLSKLNLSSDNAVFNFGDTVFQQYLSATGLRRLQQEDEIMFARRAQQYLGSTISYVPVTQIGKNGGAAILCQQRELDSAGHAVLFVSILRANSVPARVLVGHWVSGDIQPALHYRTEFFADMVGWVPVEPTEKGDSLYFGSDAKTPFLCASFGEITSQFRIQSTTSYAFGANLPQHVPLPFRNASFHYVAGNLSGSIGNVEQWTGIVTDATTTMPHLPGQSHQQPTTQRYAKAHEGGAPVVGARQRPYAQSVSSTSTFASTTTNGPFLPPPVPQRTHEHSSVQVTTFGNGPPPMLPPHQSSGPHMNSQVPPALPPHSAQSPPLYGQGYGAPPPLPAHGGYGAQGPPPLPPQNQQYNGAGYGQAPPPLPPHQQPQGQYGTLPAPNLYHPSNTSGGPPQLPPHQSGYGCSFQGQQPHNGYQQGPPPQLPPSYGAQPPQLPPQSSQPSWNGVPPQDASQYQQYQQVSPQPTTGAVPPNQPGGPTMAQPRPVSMKPQQHLANLEAGMQNGNPSGAPPKGAVKVAVLPPGPVPGQPKQNPLPTAGAGGAPKGGVAKAWPPKQQNQPPTVPLAKGPAPQVFPGSKKIGVGPGTRVPAKSTGAANATNRIFARANFDHTPQDHLELPLQKGDIIEVLSVDDSGWWKAEKMGKIGIVPAPYVEKLAPDTRIAKAVFPFQAQESTDLGLQVGEFAIVFSNDSDWWEAEARGTRGSVPNNYVQLV